MSQSDPRVVLVTGASRGAGKGIAQAFGSLGDVVYITGRTQHEGESALPGTIHTTAADINHRGGTGIPVACDHADDDQVRELFDQINSEQGRLDIMVNNATFLHDDITVKKPFWQKPLQLGDILKVGLRSSYVSSYYAAKIMSKQGSGLIVNTSSPGGACYMHGAAYGAQKAGLDKMAWDMAYDLKPYNVACISLWMGVLNTERLQLAVSVEPETYGPFAANAESTEFTGRVIDALYRDQHLMLKTGQTLISAEVALNLGVKDINGQQPPSHRDMLGGPLAFNAAVVE